MLLSSFAPEEIDALSQDHYCYGTNYNKAQEKKYICGDSRLGPAQLPRSFPLDTELETYQRFGGQCPEAFLEEWFNSTSGWWNYPPQDGFALNTSGRPILGDETLQKGTLLDRFGSEQGGFLSPAGAPYMQRALPPSNLNTPAADAKRNPSYPYNYHVYQVLKPFVVQAGVIAPWFGQPGAGVQYKLLNSTVASLILTKYLQRVHPTAILG
ncbi:hypothetical protein GQ53DRAFT_798893 [Thozetella sp. PMI_491]|nr:hypothetical protein GQ53DRAFT_798893 [Thozetella sp. PMI_491]